MTAPEIDLAKQSCALARATPGGCALAERLQVLEHIHESVITMDLAGYITGWNKSAEALFGYRAEEAIGKHILFLYADEDEESAAIEDTFLERGGRELEVRRRRKSGEVFWASLQLSLIRNELGEPVCLAAYLSDITERVEAEKTLRLQAQIFSHAQESIIITDASRRIVSVNPAFTAITGFTAEEARGRTLHFLRSPRHPDSFYDELWRHVAEDGSWHGELWSRRRSGEDFPGWVSISRVENREGKVCNYFSILTDLTERKKAEERIHYLAYYDALTGLPNRRLLYKLVDQALREAQRGQRQGAILFLDLNRFKPINDTLGHLVGDALITAVAKRLRETVRSEDVVARLGGDEFVVALFDIGQREHARIVAQKLHAAFETPFVVGEYELMVSAAIGISLFPRDGEDTETLIRLADIAMYRAKRGREGYAFYCEEMNLRALERLKIEHGLRRALDNSEFRLFFQPKVSLATGRIIGAEALVRWRHPERDLLQPSEFIPVAEESGLIKRLSAWVLDATLRQIRQWIVSGLPRLRIAVNLSAWDFVPGLDERINALLKMHQVSAEWLELEITESMLAHHSDEVQAMLDSLVRCGISLALDDFGTGYSSLVYLKRFPIGTLKIDRSFIAGIPLDANDCAISAAIASMAQKLGLRVVAEGVETLSQLAFLKSLGCEEIQGYLFARAVPAEEFAEMVTSGKALLSG